MRFCRNPFGSFGANTNATNQSNIFGQAPQTPAAAPAFGAFGQPQQQQQQQPPQQTNPFGAPAGGFGFGSTASSGATNPFGAPSTGNAFGSAFGQSLAPQAQNTTGLFGAPAATPNSAFGAPASNVFGSNPFGSSTAANQPALPSAPTSSVFGGLGGSSAPTSSIFGGSATAAQTPTSSSFGAFGSFGTPQQAQSTQQQPQQAAQTQASLAQPSMFGAFGQAPAQNTNLFGASTQPQPATTSAFSFGATTPASTVNQPQAAPNNQPSLFGTVPPKPAAPSSAFQFGTPATPSANAPATSTPFSFNAANAGASAAASSTPANLAPTPGAGVASAATSAAPAFSFGAPFGGASAAGTAPQATTAPVPAANAFAAKPAIEPLKTSFTLPSSTTPISDASKPASSAPPSSLLSSAATTASGAASAIAAPKHTPAASTISIPSTLKNKTIEEIIVTWNEELEDQVHEFQRQAVSLAEWDKKIVRNAERMARLNARVSTVEQQQRDVDLSINYILAQQAELEALLDGIDRELPKMANALSSKSPSGVDTDRGRGIELAESVQMQLNEVSAQLTSMVDQINTASVKKASSASASASLVDVTQVLNNHFEALNWIESQLSTLQKQTLETQRMGERATLEHSRLQLYNSLK